MAEDVEAPGRVSRTAPVQGSSAVGGGKVWLRLAASPVIPVMREVGRSPGVRLSGRFQRFQKTDGPPEGGFFPEIAENMTFQEAGVQFDRHVCFQQGIPK